MASLKTSKNIPGTYQIHMTREEKRGKLSHFTAYVPNNFRGLKELVLRNFRGVPGKQPQYFMKKTELKRL